MKIMRKTHYNPSVPNLKKILMGNLIENQPLLREIYREPPSISYKRLKSLGDIPYLSESETLRVRDLSHHETAGLMCDLSTPLISLDHCSLILVTIVVKTWFKSQHVVVNLNWYVKFTASTACYWAVHLQKD